MSGLGDALTQLGVSANELKQNLPCSLGLLISPAQADMNVWERVGTLSESPQIIQ